MKKIITFALALVFAVGALGISTTAEAATRVKSYYKPSTGTYVPSHYRTKSDGRSYNNWSTKGNYNPYTGKSGTKSPYKTYRYR